tara:strand:- start:78 stop:347 length:270 start_codon:yes stop_codon:yes gene_type:complete
MPQNTKVQRSKGSKNAKFITQSKKHRLADYRASQVKKHKYAVLKYKTYKSYRRAEHMVSSTLPYLQDQWLLDEDYFFGNHNQDNFTTIY